MKLRQYPLSGIGIKRACVCALHADRLVSTARRNLLLAMGIVKWKAGWGIREGVTSEIWRPGESGIAFENNVAAEAKKFFLKGFLALDYQGPLRVRGYFPMPVVSF